MRRLCSSKDTASLKALCSQLAQKPKALDVLLLFEKLPTILEPLCQLLEHWRYEEDQVEYQPVYDEFGAVLLLVLAFSYRYDLSGADIGLNADSYVSRILGQAHISREPGELTDQVNGYINSWIHGLFDSEAGGLGDDLMSSCLPQEFYLLVASLFQSVIVAYNSGYLSEESLKSGVECESSLDVRNDFSANSATRSRRHFSASLTRARGEISHRLPLAGPGTTQFHHQGLAAGAVPDLHLGGGQRNAIDSQDTRCQAARDFAARRSTAGSPQPGHRSTAGRAKGPPAAVQENRMRGAQRDGVVGEQFQ